MGYMFGTPCSPLCNDCGCAFPYSDPDKERLYEPSGGWALSVFLQPNSARPIWTESQTVGSNTWFFHGGPLYSNANGNATAEEQTDWGNLCNWYAVRPLPISITALGFTPPVRRATRLPPQDAIVHILTSVSTVSVGPQTVATAYFWGGGTRLLAGSEITATQPAYQTTHNTVFAYLAVNEGIVNGGAFFWDQSSNTGTGAVVNGSASFENYSKNDDHATVNGGASFKSFSTNSNDAVVDGNATFEDNSSNDSDASVTGDATFNNSNNASDATVNGNATFENLSGNLGGIVDGNAVFDESTNGGFLASGQVSGDATFISGSANRGNVDGNATFTDSSNLFAGVVGGLATFNSTGSNDGTVNGGAVFNDATYNSGTVNGGATFNDNSFHFQGVVNGGATFNDAACSLQASGSGATRVFIAHPTDLPVCNGTAPPGSDASATCGCG